MRTFLIAVLLITVLVAPQFVDVVARQAWPTPRKKAVALVLVGVFTATVAWGFVSAPRRDPLWLRVADIVLVAYLSWGLFTAYRDWPGRRGRDGKAVDARENLSRAISSMEVWLGLSVTERLEREKPEEGVYSHSFVRYSDGSWLEWLNPTDEKGEPDFGYYAVYSNNQRIVSFLSHLVGEYCNVERTKKPLWLKRR